MMMMMRHTILFLLPRAYLAPLFPEEPRDDLERIFGLPPATSKTKINTRNSPIWHRSPFPPHIFVSYMGFHRYSLAFNTNTIWVEIFETIYLPKHVFDHHSAFFVVQANLCISSSNDINIAWTDIDFRKMLLHLYILIMHWGGKRKRFLKHWWKWLMTGSVLGIVTNRSGISGQTS